MAQIADGQSPVSIDKEINEPIELSLRDNAFAVLSRLRRAIGLLIQTVTSRSLQNSRDLQNHLGIDLNLSWQIYKILGPVETLSILPYTPAAVSIKKLLTVCAARNAPPDRIAGVQTAFAEFEDLIRFVGGGRERLETILTSFSDSEEARQVDLHHRKAAYKAHAHFYGIEVDTVAHALIHHPAVSPELVDCLGLLQMAGMRRLRIDTEVMAAQINMTAESENKKVMPWRAIDEAALATYGSPIIPEFCSQPVPELATITNAYGLSRTMLKSRRIGAAAEIDLAFGRIWPDLPKEIDTDGRSKFSASIEVVRPTQLMIADMFVHRPTFNDVEYSCSVWGQEAGAQTVNQIEQTGIRLRMREKIELVGAGEDAARIPELPQYTELLRMVCSRFAYNFDDLDLYRFRLSYPLMDSRIALTLRVNVK